LLLYSSLMASLLPLRGFICPPRLSTAGAEIVVMLNRQDPYGSIGAMPVHWPSGIQLTLDLNHDHLIGAGKNPNCLRTPADGHSWLSQSCFQQEVAK
jgi:hypothetical protein